MTDAGASVDLARLQDLWRVPGPWTTRAVPVGQGYSNDTRFVDTPVGAYALRIYAESDPEAARYEHDVMASLQRAGLPFAVPAPLPTAAGSTIARVRGHEPERLASLAPLLPGVKPEAGNLAQARAGGEALGRLAGALASIPAAAGRPRYAPFGELGRIHPSVPDPAEAVRAIPTSGEEEKRRLLVLLARVQAAAPPLYATLPRQVVHRDYDASHGNVLFVGDAVSAVLDFEYAAEDLRALDFAIGLTWWPLPGDDAGRWASYEAFTRGYAAANPLTAAEAEAVPVLALLAIFDWMMSSAGRCRDGRDAWERVVPFLVRRALNLGDWLAANEGRSVDRLVRWSASAK